MAGDLIELFQSLRTILCVCPCCGSFSRLSDLNLKYKGKVRRTWLDSHESKLKRLEKKESLFEKKEKELRHAAVERGRAKVPKIICECLDRDIASFKYNPYDIKPLLHPVDFIVFNGLNEGKLKDVIFLSRKTSNNVLKKIRGSLESAIDKERYDWSIARVSIKGTITLE